MAQIFISHVEEDSDIASKLATGLEAAGYTTWYYERDSKPGVSYLIQTGSAIDRAEAVLLLISDASLGSNQITKEVVRSHESNIPVIPLLINVSHEHFQRRQPEWREVIGAAASLRINLDDIQSSVTRIISGLQELGILKAKQQIYSRMRKLVDVSLIYTLYAGSLVNLAITFNKGGNLTTCKLDVEKYAAKLSDIIRSLSIVLSVPTDFINYNQTLEYLRQSPFQQEFSVELRNKYSKEEEYFFNFCVLIGLFVGSDKSSSADGLLKEARRFGKLVPLPDNVIESCITEPGFDFLCEYLKNNVSIN